MSEFSFIVPVRSLLYNFFPFNFIDIKSQYTAPEIGDSLQATYESDVYAMGVTILEALCNEVQKAGQRPNLASVVGNKQALILQCVKDDPMERIKSDKIPKKLAGMI